MLEGQATAAEAPVELFGDASEIPWAEALLPAGIYDDVMPFLAEHPGCAR